MSAVTESAAALLAEPHHDGSEAFVVEQPDDAGGEAVLRVRVPRGLGAELVALRYVEDGEPRHVRAEVDAQNGIETWWRASFRPTSRATRYRWLVAGGDAGYGWLNACGLHRRDVADADDYVLSLDRGAPEWHRSAVVYEVFPDRFATAKLEVEPPGWAIRRAWSDPPTGEGPATPFELFGGDLVGLRQRLDHVERLGASIVYLTPIFPAGSTHRYDAAAFDRVDPLLGGNDALAALVGAAHERGIRVLADLTLNHCGDRHEWFRRALADPSAPEREFFWFDDALDNGYEAWLGVPSLPKLDWRSTELRERMLEVVRQWLQFGLDGWRIDVANMTGRLGELDINRDVRRAVRAAADDALVVAEHAHDYRSDADGDGWQGVMNYAGFLRPVWAWLRRDDPRGRHVREVLGVPTGIPSLAGPAAVATMRLFRAGVPWNVTASSWTLLDSHDTARFRTVAGSRERQLVGVGLQMTTPGVPMLFAGDEIGLEGDWGEDARRTMPWDDRDSWDGTLFDEYRALVALRRSSDALARGGIRYVHIGDDAIAYLRESASERLLCLASRSGHDPITAPLELLEARELERVHGDEAVVDGGDVTLPADGPAFHVWRLHG